jgi:hypothetical protein
MNRWLVAAFSTAMFIAGPVLAQSGSGTMTWKWKEASGQVVVSDRPPPASIPDSQILVRPVSAARGRLNAAPAAPATSAPSEGTAAAPAAPRTDLELDARRKKAADEQVAQQRVQEEKNTAARAENCSRARGQLAALGDGLRMTRTNDKGEREVLDDKGRAEEMQRARTVIASDCK